MLPRDVDPSAPEHYAERFDVSLGRLGLSASGAFAAALGYLYTAGYLISAQALRNYGIHRFEPVKPQYIEVGLTFTILTVLLTLTPVAAALLHFRVRGKSGLPYYRFGATVYWLNTTNIFLVLGFFVIFVTDAEWAAPIPLIEGLNVGGMLGVYLAIGLFSLVVLPIVERLIKRYAVSPRPWYFGVVEPVRVGTVLVGVGFDVLLVSALPWTVALAYRGVAYLGCAIILIGGLWGIFYWVRRVGRRRTAHLILTLGSVGVLFASYLAVSSYVWGVLRFVPMNRGGKLPLTETVLVSSSESLLDLPITSTRLDRTVSWGPVYVVEETSEFLYVTKDTAGDWFFEWVGVVGIDKGSLAFVEHRRTSGTGPRSRVGM